MSIEDEMVSAHKAGMQLYWSVTAGHTTVSDITAVALNMYDTPHERISYISGYHGAMRRDAKMERVQ